MARLVVQFPDGTPYGEARPERRIETNFTVKTDRSVILMGHGDKATDWIGKPKPDPEPDERSTVTATERLWNKAGRLAYRAGQEVPEEEFAELIGDSERERQVRER